MGVQRHHAFLQPVQHRLAVFHQPGDLAGLHPEGLAFDPAGQQQGSRHAQDAGHAEVGQEVGDGIAEPFKGGRVVAADGCDADHLSRIVEHRDVGGEDGGSALVQDAGPRPAFHDPAGSEFHGLAQQARIGGGNHRPVQFCERDVGRSGDGPDGLGHRRER